MTTFGLVGCAAGGLERLGVELAEPLIGRGHTVAITLTPAAARWFAESGELDRLVELTGLPVRTGPRSPSEARSHPKIDVYVVAPATANTVAKLASGIGDNHALAALCESLGSTPMVVFPRINAGHARHPAWAGHLEVLRSAGVELVYGDDAWPLAEPRTAEDRRPLPWAAILARAVAFTG